MAQTTLLSEIDMAARLGIKPRTLRLWRSQRVVPFYKIRNVILFDPDKVFKALGEYERVAV